MRPQRACVPFLQWAPHWNSPSFQTIGVPSQPSLRGKLSRLLSLIGKILWLFPLPMAESFLCLTVDHLYSPIRPWEISTLPLTHCTWRAKILTYSFPPFAMTMPCSNPIWGDNVFAALASKWRHDVHDVGGRKPLALPPQSLDMVSNML